jgi:cytochrome c2
LRPQQENLPLFLILLVPFVILPIAIFVLAFRHIPVQSQVIVAGGDARRGQAALQAWGCGSCHTIPGITGGDGKVGPALDSVSGHSYIAGHLRNTPDNMVLWIMHPQEVSPGVGMPDSNVPESVARDMAAYLYSIH